MKATLNYLARSPVFETEKAFSTDFPVDHVPGARRTNHTIEAREVNITAITDNNTWSLDKHGFCMIRAKTNLDADEVYSPQGREKVQDAYWYDIEAILHEHFPQYSRIECFDLTARRRDPDFPAVAMPYRPEYQPPSTVAHSDYSQRGGYLTLEHCFPGQEDYWEGKDFDILNVWRPLKGPTDDYPLAVCDYTTINIEEDIRLNDAIRRDLVGEGSLLHYNPAHKWYHFDNQGPEDLLVFRNSDAQGKRPRCFHAAVANPNATGPLRESVEVRLVAFF